MIDEEIERAGTAFDCLAEHAIVEYRQGRTISLQANADKHNIDLTINPNDELPESEKKIPRSSE